MGKETYYFSHDYNARNDPKIKRLILKLGMAGYGVYWAIIEELYINANALPTDYECIAFDMRTECDVIKSIINDFDLFVIDGDIFGSHSVERRLNERNEKSIKAKESANKRWEKYERNANALRTQSEGNAIKERKGKEIKGKDSIGKEKKEVNKLHLFTESEFFQFEKFEGEFLGTDYEMADLKFYYEAVKNWSASGGNKKIDWIATARNFMIKDIQEKKIKLKNGSTTKTPQQEQFERLSREFNRK